MSTDHVMFLDHAGFIVTAIASLAAVTSVVFAIVSIVGFIWFKKAVRDSARKESHETIVKIMTPEQIKSRVEEYVHHESTIARSLHAAKVSLAPEEEIHD